MKIGGKGGGKLPNAQFWDFTASAIQMGVMIPTVLVLIPWWRFTPRGMVIRAFILEAGVAAFNALVGVLFGASPLGTWLVGFLSPAICTAAFWYCCQLKDGRFLFLMVTLPLYSLLCDALCNIFFLRNTPGWVILRILAALVQVLLLYLFCRRRLWEMLEGNQINWTGVSLIPLALWACLMASYMPVVLAEKKMPPVFTSMITVAVVLIYVTLYRFQQATLEEAESRKYQDLLHSEIHYLEREARRTRAVEQNTRILRHDLRHYTNLLRSCLEKGDTASAQQVVGMLEEKAGGLMRAGDLRCYTCRPVLDMVLSRAEDGAKEIGAQFQVSIQLPQQLAMEEVELAVVFSNALENAFHALQKEPEGFPRWVAVKGKRLGGQFLLEFSNAFTGQLEMDQKTGLPRTKAAGHGYGLRSIASFVKKYQGAIDCRAKDGAFILRLLF